MNFQSTKIIILVCLFFVSKEILSQTVYFDPATTLALGIYSNQLKLGQNKTVNEQNKLQRAQLWVGTQIQVVKTIQNKIYKGLKEVSGTLSNGLQVKRIYKDLGRCRTYTSDILRIARDHPQFTVFAYQASQKTYEQLLEIGTDLTSILAEGDLNLATAGDRYRLLGNIESNVKLLKIRLLGVKLSLERAIRLGFWESINPFNAYINTDKDIVENILQRWERF